MPIDGKLEYRRCIEMQEFMKFKCDKMSLEEYHNMDRELKNIVSIFMYMDYYCYYLKLRRMT